MSAPLATLAVALVAKLGGLQAGLDKAGKMVAASASQMDTKFQSVGAGLKGVGAAIGASFTAAGLVGFFKATIDGIDRLNDLSDATGASIENLSALEDIAARTGTSMETVETAVIKLNKALGDATPGSALDAAFKALGLSVTQLKALDPAEALRQVAVSLSAFADDGNKARLVQELFGKSIGQVAPLLNDLAQANKLNGTLTTEQAKQTEKLNQELAKLGKNATDAAREVSGPLVRALVDFFAVIERHQRKGGGVFSAVGEKFNTDFIRARLQATNEQLAAGASQYSADQVTLKDGDMSLGGMWSKSMASERVSEYQQLQKAAQGYREELDRILYGDGKRRPANEGGGRYTTPSIGDVLGGGKKAEKDKPFISNSFDPATIAALKAMEGTDVAKLRDLESALSGLFELQRETRGDPAVLAAIAKIRKEMEALQPGAKAAAEELERLKSIIASTPSGQLQAVLVDIDLINKTFSNGTVAPEVWAESIRTVTARLPGEVKPAMDEISAFAEQAARNIQDALGDSVLALLDGKFADIGSMWANMLKRMAAQAMAAQLGKFLLGDDYGKGGNIGGLFGSIGAWFGGARASGGPVSPGRAYLVGERGPEIVVPRGAGTVLPNGTGLAAGGSTNFSVIVQGDASANTLRLINGALAQFEARMLMRAA